MPSTIGRYIVFDNDSRSPLGQVKLAGSLRESPGVRQPRRLGYYALVYVTGGHGYFRDELGFSCNLKAGDLLFLFPEIEHVYGPLNNATWDETFVVFEGVAFDLWREQELLNAKTPLYQLEPLEHWHRRIVSAVWSKAGSGTDLSLTRVCRLQGLLADIITFENRRNSTATSWLGGAVRRLEEAVYPHPDYSEIAKDLGMTYEGFRKRFAREAGVSPGRYFTQLRMQRACEMMTGRPIAVKDVARELGFFDEFHFSRQFKKAIGMTPKAFSKLFK